MKKIFPTRAYAILAFIITLSNICLCLFMPYAYCSFPLTVAYTESFDFTYIRHIDSINYDYIINMKEFGTSLDDIYWTSTQSGDYAVMNGTHTMTKSENDTSLSHEMGVSIEVRCADLYDILMKKDSSSYASSPIDIFPRIKHQSLTEETAYVLQGEGWILYTSAPVELIDVTPGSLYLDDIFYIHASYLVFINLLFITLFLLMKRKDFILFYKKTKSNLDPALLEMISDLRGCFPEANIQRGNRQFSSYMCLRYNVWLPAYCCFYTFLINLQNNTGKILFSTFLLILLSYVLYILYVAAFTAYKKKNSLKDELCRLTAFAVSNFSNLAQWDNFNIFIRISEVLYTDGNIEEARKVLDKAWKSFHPDSPSMQISHYLLLCRFNLSCKEFDNVESYLEKIKTLLHSNEKQLKITKNLYNLMLERYSLIEAAFLGKWDEYTLISEKIKKLNSDPVEHTGIQIIQNALAL